MVLVVEPDSAPLEEFSSEYRIRALVFGGLREMLRAYGAELAPILAQARLSPEALKDDFNWIPLDKFALTLALAARSTGDPCFGLKYGASGRFANNPLSYLMANAPDLRTALKSFVRYQRVFNTNAATFMEDAGASKVEWSYAVTMTNVAQLTDFVLMRFICRIQSAAGSAWRPLSVSVTHHRPPDMAEYDGARYADCLQSAGNHRHRRPTLNLPMPGADPDLFKLITRFCEQQLEQQKTQEDPLNRIRDAMLRCLQRGSTSPKRVADVPGVPAEPPPQPQIPGHLVSAPVRRHPPPPNPSLFGRKLAEAYRHRRKGRLFGAQRVQPRGAAVVRRLRSNNPAATA